MNHHIDTNRDKSNLTGLIVGYGSIGARHALILKNMGFKIICVSSRKDLSCPTYERIEQALNDEKPEVVVIATPTNKHLENCKSLINQSYKGLVLIEKPLFDKLPVTMPEIPFSAYLGYTLRFHPILQRIVELLRDQTVYSAQFSVGQYLPEWRPGSDYRKSYSSHADSGGGVLRDLSHELDLALWLFGDWLNVTAIMGKFGNLEIDCEDTVDLLGSFIGCPSLSIHLDYLNRAASRTIAVQTDKLGIFADIVQGCLSVNGIVEKYSIERNRPYIAEWQDILSKNPRYACTYTDGIKTMGLIHAVERAAAKQIWEKNK